MQWEEYFGRKICSLVGRKFSDQAKFDGDHSIESGVWGLYGRKYLSHGTDVLLRASFLNGLLLDCKESCTYLVRKYFKEWHGVLDAVEVRCDFDPSSGAVSLMPGCGVLVDLGKGEAFGDSRMCRIICRLHLASHIRRQSLDGKGWGKVERKCSRKSWMVRWVSLEAASASLLLSPVIRFKDM